MSGPATAMSMGAPGSRAPSRRKPDGSIGGDADRRWETEKGVAPVIRPAIEARHDPGPGVIGLDR